MEAQECHGVVFFFFWNLHQLWSSKKNKMLRQKSKLGKMQLALDSIKVVTNSLKS